MTASLFTVLCCSRCFATRRLAVGVHMTLSLSACLSWCCIRCIALFHPTRAITFAMQYLCSRPTDKDSEVTGIGAYKRRIIFAPFTKLNRRRRRAINRRRMEFGMVSYDVLPFPQQEYYPSSPVHHAYHREFSYWNNDDEYKFDDENVSCGSPIDPFNDQENVIEDNDYLYCTCPSNDRNGNRNHKNSFADKGWNWLFGRCGYCKARARAEVKRQARIRVTESATTRLKPMRIINKIFDRDTLSHD
ncbi:hypothetical protein V1522DRAFT_413753 [Lipomyces starkeyi]